MMTLLAPMLTRVARRYESDEQRRGDLQQEMLIALWLSLDTFEGSSSLRNWVISVAHHVGAQHVAERRISRRTERLSDRLGPLAGPHDPESIVATRERARNLLNLLDSLRPREREVLLLDLQEFDLDEMGSVTKMSRTQIRETLVRARRRLMMRMKRAELRGTSEIGAEMPDSLDDELLSLPAPKAKAQSSRPGAPSSRINRAGGSVYYIEPLRK